MTRYACDCPTEQMAQLLPLLGPYAAQRVGPDAAIAHVRTQEDLAKVQSLIAQVGAQHPNVADIAMRLSHPDPQAHAKRIWAYVRSLVEYRPEPGERVCHPYITMQRGIGDCDDMAILATSLARSAGRRALVTNIGLVDGTAHAISKIFSNQTFWSIDPTSSAGVWGYPVSECCPVYGHRSAAP